MNKLAPKTLQRRGLGLLLALLLHGLGLLLLWQAQGQGQPKARPMPARLTVNLIAVAPAATPQRQTRQRPAPPPVRMSKATLRPEAPIAATAPAPDPAQLAEAPAQPAAPSTNAASGPVGRGISQESIQRAIRQHMAEGAMRPDPGGRTTATERFGQEVQQAAVGDCLKGEFFGGGAGLLSAPFWLLAEARGKCRR